MPAQKRPAGTQSTMPVQKPSAKVTIVEAMDKSAPMPSSASTPFDEAARLDHITLDGDVFRLPDFKMKEIFDAIPKHCFKPSILRSMAYVVRDFVYFSLLAYATTYIQYLPSAYLRFAAWSAYTVLQGMVMTGIWILAHECGHGAFSKNKMLNYTMGLVMHSFLLVPFHSWRLSHSAHHKATGNLEKDTAFVPHKRESWVQVNAGPSADASSVELSHLAEDSPIVTLWNCIIHQVLGWPGYLLFNLTGQKYSVGFPQYSHFWFGEDNPLYKKDELPLIMLSDVGVAAMIAVLFAAGRVLGSWEVILLWGVPWLWVNHWIVAITFLQHTDASLPHYSNGVWKFECGASATIDRDLGFIDTHLFHDIIGTHVCHHLISSIPFYHAGEASVHIKRVMGTSYKAAKPETAGVFGFMREFWRSQRHCRFVEESAGAEGKGVWMYRNLHGTGVAPLDLTGGKAAEAKLQAAESKEAKTSGMASGRKSDVKRRFSQGHHLPATLPLLAE